MPNSLNFHHMNNLYDGGLENEYNVIELSSQDVGMATIVSSVYVNIQL